MTRDELIGKLRDHIIRDLYHEELQPGDIEENMLLFDESGLGLDSLDAVELVVILEKKYGIVLENPKEARHIFATLASLADFIEEKGKK